MERFPINSMVFVRGQHGWGGVRRVFPDVFPMFPGFGAEIEEIHFRVLVDHPTGHYTGFVEDFVPASEHFAQQRARLNAVMTQSDEIVHQAIARMEGDLQEIRNSIRL